MNFLFAIAIPATVQEECADCVRFTVLAFLCHSLQKGSFGFHENTLQCNPFLSPPSALSRLPTLCRYLETFPTVYCDKLNTKL